MIRGSWCGSVTGEDQILASEGVDGSSIMMLRVGADILLIMVKGGALLEGMEELVAIGKVDIRTKLSGGFIGMGDLIGVEVD